MGAVRASARPRRRTSGGATDYSVADALCGSLALEIRRLGEQIKVHRDDRDGWLGLDAEALDQLVAERDALVRQLAEAQERRKRAAAAQS